MPRCPIRPRKPRTRCRDFGCRQRTRSSRSTSRAVRRRFARRCGDREPIPGGAHGDPDDRLAARAEAERLWPVSADRSLRLRPGVRGGIGTPVKAVLRKLMRWYVEPLAYDQRSFNAAALRLIDDLQEQVDAARGRGGGASRREALATPMRIAVVQTPGAVRARRGRDLHRRARRRAAGARPRGRLRHRPVQVVPGRPRADPGVPLAAARPDRGRRPADRHGRRDEVPLVRRPPPREARLARAPVPPGLRARPHRARPVRRIAGGPGDAPRRSRSSTASRSARRRGCSRPRSNVAGRLERSTGLARRGAAAPAAGRSTTATTGHGDFVLSVEPARPGEADRPADRGGGARAVAPGRRRRRRPRPRTSRGTCSSSAGSTAACASPAASRPRSSPISTRRALPTYYAPVDEDFGMGPYESFLSGQAGDHGDRRRRAARRRPRRLDRPRRRARGRGRRRGGGVAARPPRRGRGLRARRARRIAVEVTWDRAIGRLLS